MNPKISSFYRNEPALNIIPFQLLGPILDIVVLIILLVIGLAIIVLLVKVFLFVLPAAIVAFIVWFLTGSIFWAGIAFLVVAFLSLLAKL